jgi:pyridoxal phosphate phosphatase PHOSPHO2
MDLTNNNDSQFPTQSLAKNLVVFDFDNTILNGNTGSAPVKKFLTEGDLLKFRKMMKANRDFIDIFKECLFKFKENGVTLDKLKEVIEIVPINEGFLDLFNFFNENKQTFDVIIVTGTLNLFVKWILEKNNISDTFKEVFSQIAEVDDETLLKINLTHTHSCQTCNTSQCKQVILKQYLEGQKTKYDHIAYVGDGENDFCPAKLLKENDILFPRETWGLHKLLHNENLKTQVKSKVCLWKSGAMIKEELEKIKNVNFQSKF